MNTRNLMSSALAAVLALGLAGCGAQEQKDSGTPTAKTSSKAPVAVAFDCVPGAQVWVNGVERGSTPSEIALEPGNYKVVFQRPGFEPDSYEIAVQGPTTVEGSLILARDGDATALAALGQALEIDIETLGDVPVHRGANDIPVLLYWPREEVRIEGLTTFRVDVSEDYEGDGVLRFETKGDTLYEEPFDPANMQTIAEIPQQVLDALKPNSKVKWGVFFEDKRKKDITVEFKVVKKDKVVKQLDKLTSSKHFSRQDPIVQSMMQAEIFLNNQLYTEALQYYLGALQMWPDSTQPYQGIVKSAQRMDLKETPVYATALQFYRGKGGQAGVKSTGLGVDSIPAPLQAPGLITKLHGVQPTAGQKGLGAGGAGVTPPSNGTTPGSATGPATELVPGNQGELLKVAEHAMGRANEAKERSDMAKLALEAAQASYDQAQQAANEARAAANAQAEYVRELREKLEAITDADPQATEKREALARELADATRAAQEQVARANELEQQASDAQEALRAADAQATALAEEAKVMHEQAERAKAQAGLPSEFTEHTELVGGPVGMAEVNEAKKVWEEAQARAQIAQEAVGQAEAIMLAAKAAAEADPNNPLLQDAFRRAAESYQQAAQNVPLANKAAQDAQAAYEATKAQYNPNK